MLFTVSSAPTPSGKRSSTGTISGGSAMMRNRPLSFETSFENACMLSFVRAFATTASNRFTCCFAACCSSRWLCSHAWALSTSRWSYQASRTPDSAARSIRSR